MRLLLLTTLLWLLMLSPALAQDEAFICPATTDGYLTPRLALEQRARVMSGVALNVRPEPSTDRARIGMLEAGTHVTVLDGPRCNQGFVWWQIADGDVRGWVAEGMLTAAGEADYWLEPRGEAVVREVADGQRRYIRYGDGFIEPEGCLEPPDDYTRMQVGFATLNVRTLAMLDQAQRIYETHRGQPINFRQRITQGSYNPGGVSASFGTHDGGGAVDLSVRDPETWAVLTDELEPMIESLRIAGFAAWVRDTDELFDGSIIHIHAIAVGDEEASPIAEAQVIGERGYFNGYNGLPESYGPDPIPDRHGDPVICRWMVEAGLVDP